MAERGIFRFKAFACRHYGSSMRIGVDAVLLGSWVDSRGSHILDVGTGCGVIALMLAQRNPEAHITAVDIHRPSVDEAARNFADSPWHDRLEAREEDFSMRQPDCGYDLIISNPPYFNAGIRSPHTVRESARHDGSLSPLSLISKGCGMLSPGGRIAMVVPYDRAQEIICAASECGMSLIRRTDVKGNPSARFKRSLLEFGNEVGHTPMTDSLVLEESPGVPTDEHRTLCRDFYLYY